MDLPVLRLGLHCLHRVAEHRAGIHPLPPEDQLPPGHPLGVEEVVDEPGLGPRVAENGRDRPLHRVGIRATGLERAGPAEDRRERGLEIMRHRRDGEVAPERALGLIARGLGLRQLLQLRPLGHPSGGDVQHQGAQPARPACRVHHRPAVPRVPAQPAVQMNARVLEVVGSAVREGAPERVPHPLSLLGLDVLQEGIDGARHGAEQRLGSIGPAEAPALEVVLAAGEHRRGRQRARLDALAVRRVHRKSTSWLEHRRRPANNTTREPVAAGAMPPADPTPWLARRAMAGPTRPVWVGARVPSPGGESDRPHHWLLGLPRLYEDFGFSRITSTRRFLARPAEVLLSATGRS